MSGGSRGMSPQLSTAGQKKAGKGFVFPKDEKARFALYPEKVNCKGNYKLKNLTKQLLASEWVIAHGFACTGGGKSWMTKKRDKKRYRTHVQLLIHLQGVALWGFFKLSKIGARGVRVFLLWNTMFTVFHGKNARTCLAPVSDNFQRGVLSKKCAVHDAW